MKIPPTITQTFTLTPVQLEEAILQYLEIEDPFRVRLDWKHGTRITGHGMMESDTPYFDGVEVTVKP